MKRTFLSFFRDLPFRRKIISICLTVSILPILLLGVFSYYQLYTQLIERERTALRESLRQEADSISHKLETYLSALNLIAWNENVCNVLTQPYDNNFDMYLAYRDTIDPLFLTTRSLNTDISAICLYTEHGIYPHGNLLLPLADAAQYPWYEEAVRSTSPIIRVSEDGRSLFLVRQIYDSRVKDTSILCITADLSLTLQSAASMFGENYRFVLNDAEGNTFYEYVSGKESGEIPAEFENTDSGFRGCVSETAAIPETGWSAVLYRPTSEVTGAAARIGYAVGSVILICLFLSLSISSLLAKITVSPLEALSANMASVEQGNYTVTVSADSRDEVGRLFHAFQKMVSNLNHLINEVLRAKIEQQGYELRILQLQINPHFLYNSLSLISGRAIMSGQEDIRQMAQLLTTFYRTMLNKGKVFLSVQAELENVKAYVQIQQIMHSYSFQVMYDIDEDALTYQIPNLILQPLAENAILHGLDCRESPGQGMLTISCHMDGDDLLFTVMDNGCGMEEEECERILTAESRGYGVKNVHQRIQLYYDSQCGIRFRSTKGLGTCATLRLHKTAGAS